MVVRIADPAALCLEQLHLPAMTCMKTQHDPSDVMQDIWCPPCNSGGPAALLLRRMHGLPAQGGEAGAVLALKLGKLAQHSTTVIVNPCLKDAADAQSK